MCVYPISNIVEAAHSRKDVDISHACASAIIPIQYLLAFFYFQFDHISLFCTGKHAAMTSASSRDAATHISDPSDTRMAGGDGSERSERESDEHIKKAHTKEARKMHAKRPDANVVSAVAAKQEPTGRSARANDVAKTFIFSLRTMRRTAVGDMPRSMVQIKADTLLNSLCMSLTPTEIMCACVYPLTIIDVTANVLTHFAFKTQPLPTWVIPFWAVTHTVGTFTFVLNVSCFVFIITRHVNVVAVYHEILLKQRWNTASDWRASTILLNIIHMKYSIAVSANMLANIFSSATLLHTVMFVALYYSSDNDKYSIENMWNVLFFALIQAAFALAVFCLNCETSAVSDVVHSPAFANRYLKRQIGSSREQYIQDASRTSDWAIMRTLLSEPWMEFCVLGFPVQDFSFLKKVAAVALTLITFLNMRT